MDPDRWGEKVAERAALIAEIERLRAALREILGLLGLERRGPGGPRRLTAMDVARTALERVGEPDWSPQSSAVDLPDGIRKYGSTGQLFESRNGQWVRVDGASADSRRR